MLVNKTILRKLMKKTFRYGGLKVANIIDVDEKNYIYIGGTYWDFWCMPKFIPKEIKAAIIEITGEIPEIGNAYRATKEENQMLITETIPSLYGLKQIMTSPYYQTMLYQYQDDTLLNFLQDKHKGIIAINSAFTDMISEGTDDIMYGEGECDETGVYAADDCNTVLWTNNTGGLRAHAHYPSDMTGEKELWTSLEDIRIPEKR